MILQILSTVFYVMWPRATSHLGRGVQAWENSSIEVSKFVTSIQTDVPTLWGFERNGLQLQPGRA